MLRTLELLPRLPALAPPTSTISVHYPGVDVADTLSGRPECRGRRRLAQPSDSACGRSGRYKEIYDTPEPPRRPSPPSSSLEDRRADRALSGHVGHGDQVERAAPWSPRTAPKRMPGPSETLGVSGVAASPYDTSAGKTQPDRPRALRDRAYRRFRDATQQLERGTAPDLRRQGGRFSGRPATTTSAWKSDWDMWSMNPPDSFGRYRQHLRRLRASDHPH